MRFKSKQNLFRANTLKCRAIITNALYIADNWADRVDGSGVCVYPSEEGSYAQAFASECCWETDALHGVISIDLTSWKKWDSPML